MCCGNKKKPLAKPASSQVIAGSQQPALNNSQAPVGQINPLSATVSNPTNISTVSRSKLIDKKL